jgi:aminobenzoyl-glutamate utilization protein B
MMNRAIPRLVRRSLETILLLFTAISFAGASEKKREAIASIERERAEMIQLSDQIWRWAETSLLETNSAKALAERAERHGFSVQRGVAGLPTAFIASYGRGKPIIGIVGEYDALPGLSQKATAVQEALTPGAPGHGCGHNLFGVGSLGAAMAIKELIAANKLSGTVRFYGTPAEERFSGKCYMARAGLFDDVEVCLAWHPFEETRATAVTGQAMVDFIVEFRGRAAHAAFNPWNGRSALDGLELLTHGLNLLREHVKPTVRIHYTIPRGGEIPNIVPDYAKLWCWVRDSSYPGVEDVMTRVQAMTQGAGLMAGVEAKLTIQEGLYERLVNTNGIRLLHTNLMALGAPQFTEEEQTFARALQRATQAKETGMKTGVGSFEGQEFRGGSSDLGDVSYVVPLLHLEVACAPFEAPWHSWPTVACSGMSIGHKGMIHAAKVLAATMVDLFENEPIRREIRAEFEEQTRGRKYRAMIPDGPPPFSKAGQP